jgi:hypothetical protein
MTPAERYAYWRQEAEEWDAQRLAAMTLAEKQQYWRDEIEKLNARMLAAMSPEERVAQKAQMNLSAAMA